MLLPSVHRAPHALPPLPPALAASPDLTPAPAADREVHSGAAFRAAGHRGVLRAVWCWVSPRLGPWVSVYPPAAAAQSPESPSGFSLSLVSRLLSLVSSPISRLSPSCDAQRVTRLRHESIVFFASHPTSISTQSSPFESVGPVVGIGVCVGGGGDSVSS